MSDFPRKEIPVGKYSDMSAKTGDESYEIYKNCKTFNDFHEVTYLSVINKLKSPNYNFTDDIKFTDNHWWVDSDPRYLLLKEINRLGLITINAQEDVCGYNLKTKVCNASQFSIFDVDHTKCKNASSSYISFFLNVKYAKNLIDFVKRNPELIITGDISKLNYVNKYLSGFEGVLTQELEKEIALQVVHVELLDTIKGRRVHAEDGLFVKIIEFLNQLPAEN